MHYSLLTSITCDEYFALQTQIRPASCQTIANLDARDFLCAVSSFGQFLIVSGVPTFIQRPLKIKMFGGQTFMFEPTLSLFSCYVSTVGTKRRYHSSRVGMDVTGRDNWSFLYNVFKLMQRRPQLAISVESEPLSPANFQKPGPFCSSAATLARFFHVEIF